MYVFPVCISVHHMCTWCPQRPELGIRATVTRVTYSVRATKFVLLSIHLIGVKKMNKNESRVEFM